MHLPTLGMTSLVLSLLVLAAVGVAARRNKVLLVSMDGFRWDYVKTISTPNLDRLAGLGTRAEYINNTFCTKTFPSHYSVATGLYEESHGIIGNVMYDPEFNETFSPRTRESKWWNDGEPIWITAVRNGLKSATYFWPGSEVKIRGLRPTKYKNYSSVDVQKQIDNVTDWLKGDIDIAVMYTPQPDKAGHKFGPNSRELREKVQEMDSAVGYLLDMLEEKELASVVNLVLTSDHGMTEIDFQKKRIEIASLVNLSDIVRKSDKGPLMHITPVEGKLESVYQALSKSDKMTVYKKEDIPEYWHYKNNRRVMPILCVADEGWSILWDKDDLINKTDRGNHGYDNRLTSMKPLFFAAGPDIRKNHTCQPFLSVDIYSLLCTLLEINPAPNNGSLERVRNFIVKPKPQTANLTNNGTYMFPSAVLLSLTLFVFLVFDFL
ncbi:ectonucleotide pyrophosphatase/phosphodiesterase family member 5-like [Saccostrea echinata]|uniref:ectonucleotide pyrophosphatase/phosphodiesterase family member 5-like n=1 Tax=Saccostrea echinata TaxID=191078 RepID=UPI002A813F8B|nr:ectonucleotide pyrophosphatase/phosphodiesterase family member 5-like [Saccostrea echinata]